MYTYPNFPNPTENSPPIPPYVTHGLGMSPAQFLAMQKRPPVSRWLAVSLTLLVAVTALDAVGLAATYVGAVEGGMVGALMTVAAVLWLVGLGIHSNRTRAGQEAAWRVYEVETAGGLTTTLNTDRAVQQSARWHTEVRFADAVFTETRELLILENGESRIYWRAADLTPEQAWVVIMRLRAAVPRERQFATDVFLPQRQEPCPPPFSNRAPHCYDSFTYKPSAAGDRSRSPALWMLLASLSLATAAVFAVLFNLTGHFVADYLIFLVSFFAGAAIFLELLYYLLRRAHTRAAQSDITLSFTDEGLLVEQSGQQRFVAARDVHATRTENGAALQTPLGQITFPWNVAHNRQQLEWMLFSQ